MSDFGGENRKKDTGRWWIVENDVVETHASVVSHLRKFSCCPCPFLTSATTSGLFCFLNCFNSQHKPRQCIAILTLSQFILVLSLLDSLLTFSPRTVLHKEGSALFFCHSGMMLRAKRHWGLLKSFQALRAAFLKWWMLRRVCLGVQGSKSKFCCHDWSKPYIEEEKG